LLGDIGSPWKAAYQDIIYAMADKFELVANEMTLSKRLLLLLGIMNIILLARHPVHTPPRN